MVEKNITHIIGNVRYSIRLEIWSFNGNEYYRQAPAHKPHTNNGYSS